MGPRGKLSESVVLDIRNRIHGGEMPADIAREMKLSHSTVHDIHTGCTYRQFGGPLKPKKYSHVSKKQRQSVIESLLNSRMTYDEVAAVHGLSKQSVRRIGRAMGCNRMDGTQRMYRAGRRRSLRKMSDDLVARARRARAASASRYWGLKRFLAEAGVHHLTLYRAMNGETYRDVD